MLLTATLEEFYKVNRKELSHLIKKLFKNIIRYEDYEDVEQTVFLNFQQGRVLSRFKPELGFCFNTYIVACTRNALLGTYFTKKYKRSRNLEYTFTDLQSHKELEGADIEELFGYGEHDFDSNILKEQLQKIAKCENDRKLIDKYYEGFNDNDCVSEKVFPTIKTNAGIGCVKRLMAKRLRRHI